MTLHHDQKYSKPSNFSYVFRIKLHLKNIYAEVKPCLSLIKKKIFTKAKKKYVVYSNVVYTRSQ